MHMDSAFDVFFIDQDFKAQAQHVKRCQSCYKNVFFMLIIYWFKHYIDSQSVDGLPLSRATGSNKNYTNI